MATACVKRILASTRISARFVQTSREPDVSAFSAPDIRRALT
jgi:hypothetical protein